MRGTGSCHLHIAGTTGGGQVCSASREHGNGAYLLQSLPAGQEGSEREKSEMEKKKTKTNT